MRWEDRMNLEQFGVAMDPVALGEPIHRAAALQYNGDAAAKLGRY